MFSKVKRLAKVYKAALSRQLNQTTSFRGSLFIWMFGIIATSYISLSVWLAVLGSREAVGSYTRSNFVQYYLTVSLVTMLTGAWAGHWIAYEIRLGTLDRSLIRPWSYLHFLIVNNIGEKIPKMVILFPMVALLGLAFRDAWQWTMPWWYWPILAWSIVVGAAVALTINICIGLIAFWTAEIEGISTFYLALEGLLSGRLIPLDLLPTWLRQLSLLAPFRYTVSLPVEIVVGTLSQSELVQGLAGQLAWLLVGALLYRVMWRYGIRAYSSAGG